jgi:integrase
MRSAVRVVRLDRNGRLTSAGSLVGANYMLIDVDSLDHLPLLAECEACLAPRQNVGGGPSISVKVPDGRQVKRTIGPAWTGRGRPPAGYYTKRTAEAWLCDVLARAREGTLPGMVRTGVTFADACAEYLRYVEFDLDRKPSTLCDYRSIICAHLEPAFGSLRLEDLTADRIEAWKGTVAVGNRTKAKILTVLNGILKRSRRVHKLGYNPMADVEKPHFRASTAIEVFSPEEIWALVRAAESEQDAAIFVTAAFTGLRRGELVALRWHDVDFMASKVRVSGSYAGGRLTTPKSGRVRSLPIQGRAAASGAATAPLPRPPSHLRHAHDRQGRHPPGPGVDGPRRRLHDYALPALRRAARRGRARGRGVRRRAAGHDSGLTHCACGSG